MASVKMGPSLDRELTVTRLIDAPRELVWKAWTDLKHLAQWWGGRNYEGTIYDLDLRPGGAIRIDMRGTDGSVYPIDGKFHEVTKPKRLVFTSSFAVGEESIPLKLRNTVTFAQDGSKTRVTLKAVVMDAKP